MISKEDIKILFYAPIFEFPTTGGPSISVSNAIKVLSKTSNLFIITPKDIESENFKSTKNYFIQICKNIIFINTPFKKFINSNKYISRIIIPLESLIYSLKILKYIKKQKIYLVWIDRVIEKSFFVYFYLDIIRRIFRFKYKLIADNEAVYSEFILRELNFLKRYSFRYYFVKINGKLCKLYEKYMLKTANVVTAVSAFDKNIYTDMNPLSNVKLFSNTIDLKLYKKDNNNFLKIKPKSVLLLGSFGNKTSPMNRARKWLLDEIMPIVWKLEPDIHLYIVGKNAYLARDIIKTKNISIASDVETTIPYLHNCDVLVTPLRHESGTRIKLIEAGAAKLPCVSTKLGAEGLNVEHDKNILITDKKNDFAEYIIKLIKDKDFSKKIANNFYDLVKLKYGIERQQEEAKIIIKSLT